MAYKLLIDAGNTRVKAALMDQEGHLEPWLNVSYAELNKHAIPEHVEGVWLALVSSEECSNAVNGWLSQANLKVYRVESQASAFGVTNSYDNPTDRKSVGEGKS